MMIQIGESLSVSDDRVLITLLLLLLLSTNGTGSTRGPGSRKAMRWAKRLDGGKDFFLD